MFTQTIWTFFLEQLYRPFATKKITMWTVLYTSIKDNSFVEKFMIVMKF